MSLIWTISMSISANYPIFEANSGWLGHVTITYDVNQVDGFRSRSDPNMSVTHHVRDKNVGESNLAFTNAPQTHLYR
jgi:hypothetical protein